MANTPGLELQRNVQIHWISARWVDHPINRYSRWEKDGWIWCTAL